MPLEVKSVEEIRKILLWWMTPVDDPLEEVKRLMKEYGVSEWKAILWFNERKKRRMYVKNTRSIRKRKQ